jgi:uncharacterized membrane protein
MTTDGDACFIRASSARGETAAGQQVDHACPATAPAHQRISAARVAVPLRHCAGLPHVRRYLRRPSLGVATHEDKHKHKHERMMRVAEKPMFLFVGIYNNADDAKADDDAVKQLYRDKLIGSYDAAVVSKDADGKVHVHKTEKPTQHGAEIGAVAGAVVGLLLPPFLLVDAAIGAVAGGMIGHFRKGMPHKDLQEIGDALSDSSAALVVVGESKLEEALKNAAMRATKTIEKQVTLDAEQVNKDLEDAVKQMTKA